MKRSLQSVLTQDFRDFEVVVVDDGSTDHSAEIVRSISDPRLRLISQENGGPSKARNTGVREAKGEWILFLDADDELLPGALKHFHELTLKHAGMDMFLGEVLMNNGQSKWVHTTYQEGELRNIFRAYALGRVMPCSGSTMYSRTVCERHLYDERIRRYEDLHCLFRKYKDGRLWLTHQPVAMVNCEFAAASTARKDIREDFMGHLPSLQGKGFWEQLALYTFFLGERDYYPEARQLTPSLSRRYDLFLAYKIIGWLRKFL